MDLEDEIGVSLEDKSAQVLIVDGVLIVVVFTGF